MQHKDTSKFRKFWRENGYYMVLGLCLVAVGVSGYLFFTGAREEQKLLQEPETVPPVVTMPQLREDPVTPEPEESQETALELPAPEPPSVEVSVMPVSGTVIQDYAMDHLSYNPTTQDWRVHKGVDLAAPLGQEVQAARSGVVTAVYEDAYLGTTVVVRHDQGYTSHYANLAQEVRVEAGEQIQGGTVIGTVGDTAILETAQEPHLHFEVYQEGTPIDPAGFLY